MSDQLPEELEAALRSSSERRGRFGGTLVYFRETGSTNDVAAALAEAGAEEGTTVVASSQTAGRGRLGREWFSPAGAGLYMSVICRGRKAGPFVTLAAGVAGACGIRCATGLPVTIKWPNDIVVADRFAPGGRRKLAGILAEASTGPDGLHHVVVGFGINVRQASYPSSIVERVTSLEVELGRTVNTGAVLAEILVALRRQIDALESDAVAAVLAEWRVLAPTSIGAAVEWTVEGTTHRGLTNGIDDHGALLVRVGGRVERIIAGELIWL